MMIGRSNNPKKVWITRYVAAIWLGLFMAGAVVPQGYMPDVSLDGSIQLVLCTTTNNADTADQDSDLADDLCSFSILQLGANPSHALDQYSSAKSGKRSHQPHQLHVKRVPHGHYPRGPPVIS
jgi:hypothetical protein